MNRPPLDRRQFNHLAAAALGGLAAGTLAGCGKSSEPGASTAPTTASAGDKHLCRGLNECKGLGKGGDNACRGQGACATSKEHSCGGQNECKGLGGCGETAGANECAGKGGCHVPLMDDAWATVRKRLETKWTESKSEFAPAPAKVEAAAEPAPEKAP